MATLTISALALGMDAGRTRVHIRLADSEYNTVAGTYGSGSIVERITEYTAADGTLSVDLVPNASITPANTYYVVWVGQQRFLIEKSASTQTLSAALVADPNILSSALATTRLTDVNDTAATSDASVLVWSSTDGEWKPGVPETGRTTRLRGLRAALAASASTPVDIVLVGDSVTHGWCGPTEASAMGVTDWPTVFERLIASRAGNTRTPGRGWLPPRSDVILGTYPYGWGNVDRTSGGTVATDGTNDLTSGCGQWGRTLAVGDTLEHTDTCDGLTVYYTAQRTGGANIEVRVDGSLLTTINTTDGTISAGVAKESGRSWTSNALTYASHAVVLTVAGSGTAIIDGGYFHAGNRASGVRVHKGGHSGHYTGSDWSGTVEHVENVQPACIVVYLGLNDYVFQATAADYQADYAALIDDFAEAAPNATIIAIVPGDNYERDWTTWHAAGLAAVASTDAILVDLQAAMGDISDSADPLDLSNDGIHLSSVGSRMLAEIIADIILPGPVDRVPVLLADGSRAATGDLPMGANKITGLATPSASTDAATKGYVDSATPASASTSAAGIVELGTDAETQTGTDTARVPSLASAAATYLRKLIPTGTTGTVTHADGGIWRFVSAFTTPGFGLRNTGDAEDRAALGINALVWGTGSAAPATGLTADAAAGTIVPAGSTKIRPGTPSNSLDAADKAYVDGRTPAASTSAAGIVELGTDAETQTGTDTTRAPSLSSAAATFVRKLLPTGTTGTITHADGGIFRFVSAFTTPGLGLRLTADADDRASLGVTALAFGDGTNPVDAGITRTAAGVIGPYGSTKIRPGTPSNTLDAADKAYVDGRTPAASTSASGLVELATTAEARTASSSSVVLTAAGGASATIDLTSTPMLVGRYYATGFNSNTLATTVDRAYYIPVSFRRACTLDRVGLTGVTATVASSVARIGLYTDADGIPGTLVFDAGTVTTASGTTAKEITVNQAVDRGRYWLAVVNQGGASGATVRSTNAYQAPQLIGSTTLSDFNTATLSSGYYENSVSAGLPATATPVPWFGNIPVGIVRASA